MTASDRAILSAKWHAARGVRYCRAVGTLSKLQVPVKCTDQKAQDLKRACARVKGVRAPKKERVMMIQKRLQPRISQNDK